MINDPMLRRVDEFITRHRLINKQSPRPLVVALSGGADSTALLASLSMLGYQCIAAHCNYHLRGDESDRDQGHARHLAKHFRVRFIATDLDVDKYRADHPGCSIEMACRELRYNWFELLRRQFDAQAIAVGHNADDNAETLLLNLIRGTGIAGLRGIRPINDRHVVRPLLCVSRAEIIEFLNRHNIRHITDSSNLLPTFNRNKIRLNIIPYLTEQFPKAAEGLQLTINNVSEADAFYRQAIEEKRNIYTLADGTINLRQLIDNEPSAGLLLYEFLAPRGFNRTQTDAMISSIDSSGLYFHSPTETLLLNRGTISSVRQSAGTAHPLDADKLFEIHIAPANEFLIPSDPYSACFDADLLASGQPLTIRYWQQGDRMKPFGMNGTKKISDIFSDAKVPDNLKSAIPLLVKGSEILWVVGLRQSDLYKVGPTTTSIATISYTGHHHF